MEAKLRREKGEKRRGKARRGEERRGKGEKVGETMEKPFIFLKNIF